MSLARLALTFFVAAVIAAMHPNAYMTFAAAGGVAIALARYSGYDVRGVPAMDLFLPVFTTACIYMIFTYRAARPAYDQFLLAADQQLGFSWVIGRAFASCYPLELVCGLAYGGAPFAFAALYLLIPQPGERARLWWSMVAASLLLGITFSLCPAAGPQYVFPGWPWHEPIMLHPSPILTDAPLNCMPSAHLAGALLMFWLSRTCRPAVRIMALLFLILTALATVGLGEHYWVDLIAALPFAAAVYGGTAWLGRRIAWNTGS